MHISTICLALSLLVCEPLQLLVVSDVRLSGNRSGIIQVEKYGTFGTICSDHFTSQDAKVVCKEAGFGNSDIAVPVSEFVFGQGTGPIHYDELACTGTEISIGNCRHGQYTDCEHSEDAGVICDANEVKISLSNGDYGLLEVTINRKKGTVCDDHFTNNAARVLCRHLGFPTTYAHWGKSHTFLPDSVPIYFDDVRCNGTENSLLNCKMSTIGKSDCFHDEDVMVYCMVPTTTTSTTVATTPACADDPRVSCGPAACNGPLKPFCPLTCQTCSTAAPITTQSTSIPCTDSTTVNCKDKSVCSNVVLRGMCKASCGLCSGITRITRKSTTSWIQITAQTNGK